MAYGSTYFGEGGLFIDKKTDLKKDNSVLKMNNICTNLKRTDESILPTSIIIGRSSSTRNEIINIDDKERFAHKWEKRIRQIKLHSKL